MKHNKISRILGVGLTIAVLASMFVMSAPVSAGNVSWTAADPLNRPPTVSGIDVLDMAVAGNGATAYAVTGGADVDPSTDGIQIGGFKTINGGLAWTKFVITSAVSTTKVSVATDVADGSVVALISGVSVYISTNGGTNWSQMAPLAGNVTALNGVSVAPAIGGARSVAAVGQVDGSAATVQYFTSSADPYAGSAGWVDTLRDVTSPGWGSPTLTGPATALAVKFSTNFLSDRTMVVVTANAAGAAYYNLANVATKLWNGAYTVYGPMANGSAFATTNVTAAAIDLPASFMAFDSTARIPYFALAGAAGGLYRGTTQLSNVSMWSVAVNAAGDKLVAGAADTNTVYRVATPATALTTGVASSSKSPSYGVGTSRTTVEFFGASVGAATTASTPVAGDETAFGLSADDGKTFNDVAFIDTVANVDSFAVKADGTKTYLVTNSGTGVTSLWRKTTGWERVYKQPTGTTGGWIVRPALDNFDVIFFAACGTMNISYSNDAGQTFTPRISYSNIDDLQAESASVIYVVSGTAVSKAVDGGYLWDNPRKTTGAGNGESLNLLAKDNLLVSGDAGVAYSTDGGTTWTAILLTGGATMATADKLSAGGVITAVAPGVVRTFTIGTSTAFGTTAAATFAGSAKGIVLSGGVTYVMTDNTTVSTMLRSKITNTVWSSVSVTTGRLSGLVAAGGNLLSLDMNPTTATAGNSIWSFTEIFAAAGPKFSLPAAGALIPINVETGKANEVVFQWTAITGSPTGTLYQLQVAFDSAFTQVVGDYDASTNVLVIVGPNSVTYNQQFLADTNYYARVRVKGTSTSTIDTPWSASVNFKIDALAPIKVASPASGASNIPVKPTFVWAPVTGATTYEIVVSDDPTFKIITFSRTTDKAMFAADEQLSYGTVYYWRVRASAPTASITPFVTGIFTTEAKPVPPTSAAPPITITTQPPATITVEVPAPVEAVPAALLYVIIVIGAILVIALIVLIVRTRRTS